MVILVLAVSVAIVTPQLMDIGEVRIKGAMRRFQGTVRYLFNESVFRRSAFLLYIDMEKGEYWVETPKVDGDKVENVEVANSFVEKRGRFPEGIEVLDVQTPRLGTRSDGQVAIQFFPHGYVEPATIHMQDRNKNRFTLWIQPVTGSVRILPGYVEVGRRG